MWPESWDVTPLAAFVEQVAALVFLCLSWAAWTRGTWKWRAGPLANGWGAGTEGELIGNTSRCVLFLPLEEECLASIQIIALSVGKQAENLWHE